MRGVETIKAHISYPLIFFLNHAFCENVEKYCRVGQATDEYDASALHAGYRRLQTHTQNM
jgi:hypothetical protein